VRRSSSYVVVEPNADGMLLRLDRDTDRLCCHVLIGDKRVILRWKGDELAPLTKVDLTPDS
jgi:hypothetical protein